VSRFTERLGEEGYNELTKEMMIKSFKNSLPKISISTSDSTVDFSIKGEMKIGMMPKASSMIRFIKSKPE
jgi:hypothetical protein